MSGTLFFVHGTGVRDAGLATTWDAVERGARAAGVPASVYVACGWGPKFGVPVDRIDQTLPPEVVTRAIDAAPDPAAERVALWTLLRDDPLFELRIAAAGTEPPATGFAVNALRVDQALIDRLHRLAATPPEEGAHGLSAEELHAAATYVSRAPELADAALAVGDADDADLVEAVARAVVAFALAGHRADAPGAAPPAVLSGSVRDALVLAVAAEIAPVQTRGLGSWLKARALQFVARKATAMVRERREAMLGLATPAAGDILFYQRRGDGIRTFVRDALLPLEPPVVVVAHSLGGVIMVDLLSRPNPPRVDLLVTAGSQSPFFYAIDALGDLRPGGAASAPFSPWLNIYSRSDFLSFVAREVFGRVPGVVDAEIDAGVPFPASHSAYWHEPSVYELIRDSWPGG